MQTHPLAEVFGFPADNLSAAVERYRNNRLCPYNNRVPSCTKDKANDPLGVCSIYDGEQPVITCPVRFRQDWLIAEDAAHFFFPSETRWTSLTEVRLNDRNGRSAGNIDVVIVAHDQNGKVLDFGSLEVQGVYISGNVRLPFAEYMKDRQMNSVMDWRGEHYWPRPDYLSSSRKRLMPQLLYKGGILAGWGKKQAVAVQRPFFDTLPELEEVSPAQADLAWMLYDLKLDPGQNRYELVHSSTIYTSFDAAVRRITTAEAGPIDFFVAQLQEKLEQQFESGHPPDAPTLSDPGLT